MIGKGFHYVNKNYKTLQYIAAANNTILCTYLFHDDNK